MAQITVYAKTNSMNWDAANGWNSQADGLGTDYTNPQNGGGNTYICDCNGKTGVVINLAVTVDQIKGTDGTGWFSVVSNVTVTVSSNPGILYSGTSTSGLIRVSANLLTITHDQGSGTTAVQATSSGYAIVTSSTGGVAISNSGGTVLESTGTGRALSSAGNHASQSLTGLITSSGNGAALQGGLGTFAWSGNASASNGYAIRWTAGGTMNWTPGSAPAITMSGSQSAAVLSIESGTWNILGTPVTTNSNTGAFPPLRIAGGTINWTGSRSIAASAECVMQMTGGTVNLATASAALALANSGTFVLEKRAGTLNTADAGAGAASIACQSATSYAAIPGGSDANKGIITYPASGGGCPHILGA